MDQRIQSIAALLVCVGPVLPAQEPNRDQDPLLPRPNVLLLTMDQLAYDYIGLAAHPEIEVETPTIDLLAAEGTLFTLHVTDGEVCHPSRCSMLTGRDVITHGALDNGIELLPREVSLAEVLRDSGYATGAFGKVHNESEGALQGFEEVYENHDWGDDVEAAGWARDEGVVWIDEQYETGINILPENLRQEVRTTSFAIDFMRRHRGGLWFCYLSYNAPHAPFAPTQTAFEEVFTWDVWGPVPNLQVWNNKPEPIRSRMYAMGMDQLEFGTSNRHYRAYTAMIEEADQQLGRVYGFLEAEGLLDDTIVVFTSDHGDMGGQLGVFNKLYGGYRSVSHVPMVIRFPPNFPAGSKVDVLTQHSDIAPTIYEILETPAADRPEMTGSSLLPAVEGGVPIRDLAFTVLMPPNFPELKCYVATDGRYTYLNRPASSDELYDLEVDPEQERNLVDNPSYASIAADLLQAIQDFVHGD